MALILIIVLLILALGGLPGPWWPGTVHSWGYGPSGVIGIVLIVLIILLLMGRI
jgi:hypothetical protein